MDYLVKLRGIAFARGANDVSGIDNSLEVSSESAGLCNWLNSFGRRVAHPYRVAL